MAEELIPRDVERLKAALPPLPEGVERPALVAVSGLPGSGKTHFSQRLAERLSAVVLESDFLRRVLFARPTYGAEESHRLFEACYFLIEELLRAGRHVIFDATNLRERHRQRLYDIADRAGAKLVLVRVRAPVDIVRERLLGRRGETVAGEWSEASWEVYLQMRRTSERIRRRHIVVDTSRNIEPAVERVTREVERR